MVDCESSVKTPRAFLSVRALDVLGNVCLPRQRWTGQPSLRSGLKLQLICHSSTYCSEWVGATPSDGHENVMLRLQQSSAPQANGDGITLAWSCMERNITRTPNVSVFPLNYEMSGFSSLTFWHAPHAHIIVHKCRMIKNGPSQPENPISSESSPIEKKSHVQKRYLNYTTLGFLAEFHGK